MKGWWIVVVLGVLAAVAVWRASRSQGWKTTSAAVDVSASSSTTSASGSAATTFASASASAKDTLEPLYERTVHGRVVRVTRGHVAASSFLMHGALAQSRSGEWVSAVLRIPIEKLDDEPPAWAR